MVAGEAKTRPGGGVAETVRERETFRYDTTLLANSIINDTTEALDPSLLSTSSDPVLNSLTQLGTLRLNARRALISLFDLKRQHIVAEATRSIGIGPSSSHGGGDPPGDELWLSGTAIPRSYGVCEHVLVLDSPISRRHQHASSSTAPSPAAPFLPPTSSPPGDELPVCVVPDLTADERFCSKPYVGQDSSLRFYAGVPIRSPRGINIGVYCIFDHEPRDKLDEPSMQFLREVSQTIMSYLSSKKSGESNQRSERMVRGLGSLVEGKESISQPWSRHGWTTGDDGSEKGDGFNNKPQDALRHQNGGVDSDDDEATGSTPQTLRHAPLPPLAAHSLPTIDAATENSDSANHASEAPVPERSGPRSIATAPTAPEEDGLADIRAVFSRAANIITESVEVDGALFLDAKISSFGGLVTHTGTESRSQSDASSREASASSSEDNPLEHEQDGPPDLCKVLGFSQPDAYSMDGDETKVSHPAVTEAFLRSLLRRYPQGHIFDLDANGAVQSGESSEEDDAAARLQIATERSTSESGSTRSMTVPSTSPRRRRKPSHGAALAKLFPGARGIILVPLWDSHRERWFAGGLCWTYTPARVFSVKGELNYLKAFGMAMMSEIARLEVLRSNKAKADILGSLSHELRSPLHGVVLGVELLHDTGLDGFQEEVVNTLETCGRTLLDTVDHLLDFSKINHFTKFSGKRRKSRTSDRSQLLDQPTPIEIGMRSLFSDISLDKMAEEVIESVFAGFSFQQHSSSWGSKSKTKGPGLSQTNTLRRLEYIRSLDSPGLEKDQPIWIPEDRVRSGVLVYLRVDPSFSWDFYAQPGALRRIIMNIFGNALKYTKEGSIAITLSQDPPAGDKGRSRRRMVHFTVSDSGKGISEDYLRDQIFVPFSQEDSLSPGTGLGLSLVKQITTALNGNIQIASQVRRGTAVRVSLPLRRPRSNSGSATKNLTASADFAKHQAALQGLTVSCIGFNHSTTDDDAAAVSLIEPQPSAQSMMEDLCQSWFGMQPPGNTDGKVLQPAIYLCNEEALSQIPTPNNPQPPPPVVVVCRNALIAHELAAAQASSTSRCVMEFISQPVGPRKLARVFALSLKQHASLLATHLAIPGSIFQLIHPKPLSTSQAPAATPSSVNSENKAPIPQLPKQLPDEKQSGTDSKPSQLSNVAQGPNGGAQNATTVPSILTRNRSGSSGSSTAVEQEDGPSILLVDDNAINLKILASYMKKLGRRYDTAVNGLEALEAYRQRRDKYRCIFMDISMPVMDGLESTRHIRAFEQQQRLPPSVIIALTGLASADTQQEAFASGIDIFLTKPVPLKELGKILEAETS